MVGAEWTAFEVSPIGPVAMGFLHESPAWVCIIGLCYEHLARLLGVGLPHVYPPGLSCKSFLPGFTLQSSYDMGLLTASDPEI